MVTLPEQMAVSIGSKQRNGKMKIILDNLIYDKTIEPIIAVFLDPRNPDNLEDNRRSNEYRNNINFVKYVTLELVPDIDANYKTNATPGQTPPWLRYNQNLPITNRRMIYDGLPLQI